jgi:hypothetical protein
MFSFKKTMLMSALFIGSAALSACGGGGDDKSETRWLEASKPDSASNADNPRKGQCKSYLNGLPYDNEGTGLAYTSYPTTCIAWY